MKIKSLACAALAMGLFLAGPARAQQPGASGGEPGFAGMGDNEDFFTDAVKQAAQHGKKNQEYLQSLIQLGMFYNRQERFKDAARVLSQALAIVDAGALKPTPAEKRQPERVIEHHDDASGTVSATVIRTPMPYEETMEGLLPALITAEVNTNALQQAESHVKRLIALPATNQVTAKLNLMSAYTQYADILRKLHRTAEAAEYQKKAEQINSSFKPL